ncbi:hypothetical protein KQ939_09260 [Planococcus sp. CP5-4]|uniref:hypothetical protein n=1 Tax=unclassified Planococcus (in: firmicutes) TaxID=2662419 RepID=UPI001C2215EC|nr:hypothetical protein [Planococcus sp. CP5-4]MBU9674755.1 hypothetical protein [Planococcus sp. CP5-4_YE]MBV0908851.1 hypothetical protein [Planococcus sp. CP5-4_UN]MBW6063900.1 hypothetical protein [Planococcus sp. CP5-4]
MDKLNNKLRAELASNKDVTIVKELSWHLPLVSYDVSFARVKRLKMDILMKMLLLAFQEADIRRPATLAEMLFVEELFIRDLIDKMHSTQLIRLDAKGYRLTDKGYGHLEKGIFEEAMEDDEAIVSFSAVHDSYGLSEDVLEEGGKNFPPYRYAISHNADTERIHELLTAEKNSAEDGYQVIVADISSCEEHGTEYIPCIEFQLYDQKQDLFYARVWNTRLGAWDEMLEKQIEEKELVEWREAMKNAEPS